MDVHCVCAIATGTKLGMHYTSLMREQQLVMAQMHMSDNQKRGGGRGVCALPLPDVHKRLASTES